MKRFIYLLSALLVLFGLFGCSKTRIDDNAYITLTFIYGEKSINVTLPQEEAASVRKILNEKSYDTTPGVPSCGFDRNISLSVGSRVFAVACDTCNTIQDLGNLKYFTVSQEEIEYIHDLFIKYGGYFPCV